MYADGALAAVTGGPLRPGGFLLTERLSGLCGLRPGERVVDLGCGSGWTVGYLAKVCAADVIGFDLSPALLGEGLRRFPDLPVGRARAAALPLASGRVDAALAECSLTAAGDVDSILAEAWRILRPDGRLGISDVYVRNTAGTASLRALSLTCGIGNALEEAEWRQRLAAHGFAISAWEDHSAEWKRLAGLVGQVPGAAVGFWAQSEPVVDPFELLAAAGKARIGYFIATARKIG